MSNTVRMKNPKNGEIWKMDPAVVPKWVAKGWARVGDAPEITAKQQRGMVKQSVVSSGIRGAAAGTPLAGLVGAMDNPAAAAVNAAPFVGGFFGPEGALAGAAVRQLGAKALDMEAPGSLTSSLTGVKPESPLGIAGDMVEQTVAPWALGKVGQGASKAGVKVMQWGAKLTPAEAKTAIEYGIKATAGGRDKMVTLMKKLGEDTRAMVARASASGWRVGGNEFGLEAARRLLNDDVIVGSADDALRDQAMKFVQGFLRKHSGDLTAARLHVVKQQANRVASEVFKAVERGDVTVDPKIALRAHWNNKIYELADELLGGAKDQAGNRVAAVLPSIGGGSRTITPVTGYAGNNSVVSSLKSLEDALWPTIKEAERGGNVRKLLGSIPTYPMGVLAAGGLGAGVGATRGDWVKGAIAGGALGGLAFSPMGLMLLARTLANTHVQKAVGHTVRGGIVAGTAAK